METEITEYKETVNQLVVCLSDNDKYNTSIYEQLATIKAKYPAYDTAHAIRTNFGWIVIKKDTLAECLNCGDKFTPRAHNFLQTKSFGDIFNCDVCVSILAKMGNEARNLLS